MSSESCARLYLIDDLVVNRGSRRVTRNGETLKVTGLTFDFLLVLAEASPSMASYEHLAERVWQGRPVTAETIAQRAKILRSALSDNAQDPHYLELIRSQGYRLIPAVQPVDERTARKLPVGRLAIAAAVVLATAAAYLAYLIPGDRSTSANSAQQVSKLLLEFEELRRFGNNRAALEIATKVAEILPKDEMPTGLWNSVSWSADLRTTPPDARVYRQPVDASADEWEDLGTTPLDSIRFAEAEGYRLRFELDGYRSVEVLHTMVRRHKTRGVGELEPIRLDPVHILPEDMVRIPGFQVGGVVYDDYFMDRFETTNREFARFVNSRGYEEKKFWKNEFIRNGERIPWEVGVREFVDKTGRPGPSTWSGGTYPRGQGNYPVTGVSWYEAAAYASFAGKALPTGMHSDNVWRYFLLNGSFVVPSSNLDEEGPWPVGKSRAMNTLGVYDLVGNVREWVWNELGKQERITVGGAWNDLPHTVVWPIPKSPWDRHATHGFRLVRLFDSEESLARLKAPMNVPDRRDFSAEDPASDAEFEIFRRMYAYDPLPLNAQVTEVEEFEYWTRERVAFDLPYGERGGAYIFIPNDSAPPYETVLYWPGASTLEAHSVDDMHIPSFDFLLRSGRAVALPMFKGTFDRDDSAFSISLDTLWPTPESSEGTRNRDFQIKWLQDLSRTIDYAKSRDDIDTGRLGYYGVSWGGFTAPIVLALEGHRIDAAVVRVGGLDDVYRYLPEADPFNFVTRVRTPILMINGQYDVVYPLETSQKPMFDLLGTDPQHKKHVVMPGAHVVPRNAHIRETLNWFDRYLSESARQEHSETSSLGSALMRQVD